MVDVAAAGPRMSMFGSLTDSSGEDGSVMSSKTVTGVSGGPTVGKDVASW